MKYDKNRFSTPKFVYLFTIVCTVFSLFTFFDVFGIHSIYETYQLVTLSINMNFMLVIAYIVFISSQFSIIISKISKKGMIGLISKILAATIVLVCWSLNIYFSVLVFNWKKYAFGSSSANIFNLVICSCTFIFLSSGSVVLLKKMSKISRVKSDLAEKKKKKIQNSFYFYFSLCRGKLYLCFHYFCDSITKLF